MASIDNEKKLSGRERVVLKAIESFCPPRTKNPVNWEAFSILMVDYDNNPAKQEEILNKLTSPAFLKKCLQEAECIYSQRVDTKQQIEELLAKVENGFKKQDDRLGALEDASKKHSSTNEEQTKLLEDLKERAEVAEKRVVEAEKKAKRQKRWAVTGKVLGVVVGAFLALCTLLGVPTKYTQPLIDKFIDPALEKVGLYRPQKAQKPEELSQQPKQPLNPEASPNTVSPPSDPLSSQPAPLHQKEEESSKAITQKDVSKVEEPQKPPPSSKARATEPPKRNSSNKGKKRESFGPGGTQKQSVLQFPVKHDALVCYRSRLLREMPHRTYHV